MQPDDGKAMEALIGDGFITGVADITTTEWCDELVGGVLAAGPDRLNAAAQKESLRWFHLELLIWSISGEWKLYLKNLKTVISMFTTLR